MHLEEWHDFFVALAGAMAAIAGLLFVALSINIERILKTPWLPPRAAMTMLLLVGGLLEALVALLPHPTTLVLGIVETLVAFAIWAYVVRLSTEIVKTPSDYSQYNWQSITIAQVATLPALAGAIAILCGLDAGLFGIAFAALASIGVAFLNAWVLLVEILR